MKTFKIAAWMMAVTAVSGIPQPALSQSSSGNIQTSGASTTQNAGDDANRLVEDMLAKLAGGLSTQQDEASDTINSKIKAGSGKSSGGTSNPDAVAKLQKLLAWAKASNLSENDTRYQLIKARLTIDGEEPDALTVAVFNVIFGRDSASLKAFLTDDDYAEKFLKSNSLIVDYVRLYMENKLTPEMQDAVNKVIQQLFPNSLLSLPGLAS